MSRQATENKKERPVSVLLICLFLIASISFPIVGRWGSFRAFQIELMALVIWIVWIIHLGWILSRRILAHSGRIHLWTKIFGAVLASVIAVWVACLVGSIIGKALRYNEIKTAVDAGLQGDCMKLLINWPVKNDRIEDFDPEFSRLPSSIKMFAPAYVLNANVDDKNIPPNIGLCKNGFGGFAFGIRVFRNDQDAGKFITDMESTMEIGKDFECHRIASGVYYWWQDT